MSKKILIDASNANETRIAVTENGKLDDFEIESNKKNAVKGDVYLAKITRVEPSLQAAFVDFGSNRNGFLPLTEIHPDYFKIPSADENKLKELIEKQSNEEEVEENYESSKNTENKDDKSNNLTETRKIGLHRLSERSSTNSRKVKKKLGYTCQVCGFNFKKVYGKISLNKKKEEFIEAHHKIPIHSLPENETIEFNIDDFAVLCSNCHRMAHKRKEPYTIEELKGFIKKRK